MKAIELSGFEGLSSLRVAEVEKPKPGPREVLIEVRAAGINFAEVEMTKGKYPTAKKLPFVMGFEAAGVVVETGPQAANVRVGDRVAAIVSSGGYAEYATADAGFLIPIPDGISFAEAVTIPVQGLSAYTLLKYAAKPQPNESLLIQSAAGGVGLFLVQLAKFLNVGKVIALASSQEKLQVVKSLGADVAIDSSDDTWADQVRAATGGEGVDVVLESASGTAGDESFRLMAPFGRTILFGARNFHDSLSIEKVRQLILKNQSVTGFNFPSLRPEQIGESVPALLEWIGAGKIKLFANHTFALADVRSAFEALASRRTIGKVVLTP